jgi:hypothetical protein
MNEYADAQRRPARDKRNFGYQRVQSYAYVALRAHPGLQITPDILATMSLCGTNIWGGRNPSAGMVWKGNCEIHEGVQCD